MAINLSVKLPSEEFLTYFSENEVPPRSTPADYKHEIIIFHELVDRFSHWPRFPAAPQPNYRCLAIRHRGDSKKSTHPSPSRDYHATASLSREHFYKNAETNHGRLARSHRSTASPVPFVSFPLFTRRRGRHPGGAATARTQNIDHRKKSHHQSKQSSREHAFLGRHFGARRESSGCGLSRVAARLFFRIPARRLTRAQQVVHSVDAPAAHTTRDVRTSHNFSPLRAHAT